ncbi:hypothetical protein CQW23_12560 [Capsicum baccatum]|uniref:Uncharacterized protein n=1 Tax=Capsicum baccatum TaxID=33114 RepID=A0A2G2WT29_CAPBA|nr:hypothetical protein CQW23_12560 [Capsicum baccatum]
MGLKSKISRENTNSRRFSASYIGSFREDAKCFRSNIPISSTVSSPGYTLRDEIHPSTYSLTTVLKGKPSDYLLYFQIQDLLLAVDSGDDDAAAEGVASPVAGSRGEVGGHGWCSGGAGKGRVTEKALTEERDNRR